MASRLKTALRCSALSRVAAVTIASTFGAGRCGKACKADVSPVCQKLIMAARWAAGSGLVGGVAGLRAATAALCAPVRPSLVAMAASRSARFASRTAGGSLASALGSGAFRRLPTITAGWPPG